MCIEAELGNAKKMRRILHVKKIFCIPWLLVGDILLTNYPDKYDSEEYRAKIAQKFTKKENNQAT